MNQDNWKEIKEECINLKTWLIYNKGKSIAYVWDKEKFSDKEARKKAELQLLLMWGELMYQPERLKARRKELKMTQKDITDQLGISYQAY